MAGDYTIPREGDLYMVVTAYGHTFEIRYGYYEDSDRENSDPVAIYPDLRSIRAYSAEGYRLVTAVQLPCEHYEVPEEEEREECCSDCIYYPDMCEEISICLHEKHRINAGIQAKEGFD